MAETILADSFYICSSERKDHRGTKCRVSLSQSSITIDSENEANKQLAVIRIDDVVGCLCMRGQDNAGKGSASTDNSVSVYLSVFFYSLSKTFTKSVFRKRETTLLRCCKYATFEENCEVMARWQSAIFSLIQGPNVGSMGAPATLLPVSPAPTPTAAPRLLIFVNPNSGPGVAVKVFNTRVRTFLGEANISYDLVVTTHPGHCQQMIQESQDLNNYTGLVAVSGDGLLYEIYNGLFARSDWEQVRLIPVGIIPQGSGNGLARSLAHFNKEPYLYDPLVVSALNVVKLKTAEMDLMHVNTVKQPHICSFLSVGWGLIADIDIESERLRMIGEARFTVWALARVMRLRTYKATVSYLPVVENTADVDPFQLPPLDEPLPANQGWIMLDGEFVCLYACIAPFIGTDVFFSPKSTLTDGVIWLMVVKAPVTKVQIAQLLLGLDDGSHSQFPWLTFVPVRAFRLVPESNAAGHQSHLAIDGERIDVQPIQAQIMPRKGRIFMR